MGRLMVVGFMFVLGTTSVSSVASERATRVVVDKSDRLMMLYRGSDLLVSYRVALGGEPVGPKRLEGDERTPEGVYTLDRKVEGGRFGRAIHISYPNERDRYVAEQNRGTPGNDVTIHGQPKRWAAWAWLTQRFDWTDGSIALSNPDMERVWAAVDEGTPIEITP